MNRQQIPSALIRTIGNANESGKGYKMSPGYGSCWQNAVEKLIEQKKIRRSNGKLFLVKKQGDKK
jgi:hypothetical protein